METMITIFLGVIAIVPPTLTVVLSALQSRFSKRESARQAILLLMIEDKVAYYTDGSLPANYQNILHDFDIYKKAYGNSYVEAKIKEYEHWIKQIEQKAKPEKTRRPH